MVHKKKRIKGLLLVALLLIFLLPRATLADRPYDIEEFGSVDELASTVVHEILAGVSPASGIKKIKLAVIPVGASRTGVFSALSRRLSAIEGLWLLEQAAATAFIEQKKEAGPLLIPEMMKTFGLDLIVTVREHPVEGKGLVLARIFYSEKGRQPATLSAFIPPVRMKMEGGGPIWSEDAEWTELPALPVAARYFESADLDGDGAAEYLFSDGERLFVYRLEASGWQEVWAEQPHTIKSMPRHIALSISDINGNGRPEIFVVAMERGRVSSSVWESRGNEFVRVSDMPGFLRAISFPGRGGLLLWQGFSENSFYAGVPREYVWTEKGYMPGPEFRLPKGAALFGFSVADFGEPSPLLVSLDEKGRFRIFSRDTTVWESQERYGAAETVAVESSADIYTIRQKAAIMGRVVALDIDMDGSDEIIIPRNVGATIFRTAREAEIHILSWTGARLEQTGYIKGLRGQVLDYQVVGTAREGLKILALVHRDGGAFSKPASRLVWLPVR